MLKSLLGPFVFGIASLSLVLHQNLLRCFVVMRLGIWFYLYSTSLAINLLLEIRTMKSAVKDELTIPQQTRYLVSIDLGRVERHVGAMFQLYV